MCWHHHNRSQCQSPNWSEQQQQQQQTYSYGYGGWWSSGVGPFSTAAPRAINNQPVPPDATSVAAAFPTQLTTPPPSSPASPHLDEKHLHPMFEPPPPATGMTRYFQQQPPAYGAKAASPDSAAAPAVGRPGESAVQRHMQQGGAKPLTATYLAIAGLSVSCVSLGLLVL